MAKSIDIRPLVFVQFSTVVNLDGSDFPTTQYRGDAAKLDYERQEILIGYDVFPMNGGLVAHYRLKK